MLEFRNCQITIGGINILADSASLNQESSTPPNYALGFLSPFDNSPSVPLRNTISLSYVIEPESEPCYKIITGLKAFQTSYSPTQVILAGYTGNYYLDSFSFQIAPNEVNKANVSFVNFDQISGNLTAQNPNIVSLYNTGQGSGVSHYWSTYFTLGGAEQTGQVLNASYNFKSNWNPIFCLGSRDLNQMDLSSAQETVTILSENNTNITFSGLSAEKAYPNFNILSLNNISSLWGTPVKSIIFPLSGHILNNIKINVVDAQIVTVESVSSRSY